METMNQQLATLMLSRLYDQSNLTQQKRVPVMYMLLGSTVYLVVFIRERPIAVDAFKMSRLWLGVKVMVRFATTLPEENPLISTLTCCESHMALISGDL